MYACLHEKCNKYALRIVSGLTGVLHRTIKRLCRLNINSTQFNGFLLKHIKLAKNVKNVQIRLKIGQFPPRLSRVGDKNSPGDTYYTQKIGRRILPTITDFSAYPVVCISRRCPTLIKL